MTPKLVVCFSIRDDILVAFLTIDEISGKVLQLFLWNLKKVMKKKTYFFSHRSLNRRLWSSQVSKLTFFSEFVHVPDQKQHNLEKFQEKLKIVAKP